MTGFVKTNNGDTYRLEDVKAVTYVKGEVIVTYMCNGEIETSHYSEKSLKDGMITFM